MDQTRFGHGEGNCTMAAVCSVMEIDLEEPEGMYEAMREEGSRWWDLLWAFCFDRGWLISWLELNKEREIEIAPEGFSVQTGTNWNGVGHAVVALDGVMVHDPNPNRRGLQCVQGYVVFTRIKLLEMKPRIGPEPRSDRPWAEN